MKEVTSNELQATSDELRTTSDVLQEVQSGVSSELLHSCNSCTPKSEHLIALSNSKPAPGRGRVYTRSLEEYDRLVRQPWLKRLVEEIRQGDESKKTKLPFRAAHYYAFKDNHRAQKDIIKESFTHQTVVDVDDPDYVERAIRRAKELNHQEGLWKGMLMHMEYSARRKLHIDIRIPRGMTIEEAQQEYCRLLDVPFDKSCTSPERFIYLTPIEDEIYRSEEWYRVVKSDELRATSEPCGTEILGTDYADEKLLTTEHTDNADDKLPCGTENNEKSASSVQSVPNKLTYHGLPASEIVQKYWELTGDGLPPTQGDRNTKIFDLACSLRHIFNFDRELLNRAIPNYEGFPQEEKMQCIDNAIREPRKYMPMKLTRVLQALKAEHAENPELVQALDVVEQETMQYYAKKLPRKIGLGVDAALGWLPQELHVQALVSMAPALGALLTRVRLDVHGDWNTLNLQSFVVGEAGSGKSRFARIDAALMKEFYAESIANQRVNEQHRREKERKRNAKEVPVYDMLPERCIPPRHSVAQVLDMLNSNGGLHCYTFAEEADIMSGNGRQAFADTSAIRRVAYDASSYAQAYKSDSASRLTIGRVLWNLTQCGTPDALYRAYRNFTDGELSRVAIARMPDNTFSPLTASRPFGEKESLPLEQLGKLLPLMEGDVRLDKLEKHATRRIEAFRLECLKNFDRVAARTRLRIPVTVMRMVCALACCRLASQLVEKIDKAKRKPAWADGARTAEEYLKSHPSATSEHLAKMQDEEMMQMYDTLTEYLTDTQLYYFRSRIEQAYESDNYKVDGRVKRGKNDSVFERLPQKFDLRMAASAKGHATADTVIRQMVHLWCKQGLTHNLGNGQYEKCLVC